MMSRRAFIPLWTVATLACVAAFVLHLAMRGRTIALGYELGRARAEQARLREVKRVLQVEAASYKTPERVELVARTLLGMGPPPPDRIVPLRAIDEKEEEVDPAAGADLAASDEATKKPKSVKGAAPP
jgi:hypothetical protein